MRRGCVRVIKSITKSWLKKGEPLVYFIHAAEMHRMKIGHAKDPIRRTKDLQVGSSCPLLLVGVKQGGVSFEKSLHDHFKHLRCQGEWFECEPELFDWMLWHGVPGEVFSYLESQREIEAERRLQGTIVLDVLPGDVEEELETSELPRYLKERARRKYIDSHEDMRSGSLSMKMCLYLVESWEKQAQRELVRPGGKELWINAAIQM
jgi:hypothetical protein